MKGYRCSECKRLIKDLTQTKRESLGEIRIEGYCENCHSYTSWPVQASELEDEETEPASGGFTGYVAKIKKLLTKNNEVMALLHINGNECVAFPLTWLLYGKVLESGKELQIVAKEDNSKGYLQFIIESAGLLHEESEESEAAE